MLPVLQDGDTVLVDPRARPAIGDIVVCRHPFHTNVSVVKRLTSEGEDGALDLRGDNPASSTDSRSYGEIPRVHYRGRATCRWPR